MSGFLSLLGWSFLPNLVTGWLQTIYYSITIRAGDPKPRPGTPRYAEHRRRIHILVVSVYLLYTIYEADYELQRAGSYYSDLNVPLDASERDIKSRFRRLAALYHPDKVQTNGDEADVNDYFVKLKLASETLLDPVRRFAYERFGPDIIGWQRCVTVRDYVYRGAKVIVPYYAAAAFIMYGLGMFGYLDWGRYERWLVLAVMFVFELHTVTRPYRPAVVDKIINPVLSLVGGQTRSPYLPFQAIALVRKLSVTVFIGISQIGPMLLADTSSGQVVPANKKSGNEETLLRQGLDRLEEAAMGLNADTTRLLEVEMAPFQGDEEMMGVMKGKIKEWLVQNTIRADPMVRDALGRSFTKRRIDAPAGAKGTR
ncbi:hypothetical protein B0H66DRAFT_600032 [Apodospora peruviana]|uniref:J domain-containing protein n=1 Tax=Apodospora peruviana TaxID=516989 RepID=A0AAE0IIU8_9PEZI|nr:hypothetical protein B0H66DRAFT_600032 [Apodospora peruviana]